MSAPYYKERPILYSTDMVIARNAGKKTQTRRTTGLDEINKHPNDWKLLKLSTDPSRPLLQAVFEHIMLIDDQFTINCRYGKPGDHLYVRETCQAWQYESGVRAVRYVADSKYRDLDHSCDAFERWIDLYGYAGKKHAIVPSIHMPRWASRGLDLIENIRLERLLGITVPECIEEGAAGGHGSIPGYPYNATPWEHYRHIWESINGPGSWDKNPWVWVIEFKVVKS